MTEQGMDLGQGNVMTTEPDEPAYPRIGRFTLDISHFIPLLIAAGLPLVDGFYLTFLATGLWRQPAQAAAFGLSAFSGAACVVTAMQLTGSLRQRLAGVVAIYGLLAVGATVILAGRPLFESLLPPNLNLFTAVFLIGLALTVSGEVVLRRYAGYTGWMSAIKVMVLGSILNGFIHGINWRFVPDVTPLPAVLLAVGAGFGLTLVGVLLGYLLGQSGKAALRPLRLGATVSLLALALNVLGMGIPSPLVLVPLLVGTIWTVAQTAVSAIQSRKTITYSERD